jgi:1-aminocyclopropane-1-carboxylate deaminase/D-cysteine desulfhydrase-like pyridoxal-dependent ACC family enzyme
MQPVELSQITIDRIDYPSINSSGVKISVLRLDKIHPVISGNKWFKLKYHLEHFKNNSYKGILTFGGAWSNHIVAAACACFLEKIECVGIIRGEKPLQLSFTLREASRYGMKLDFINRQQYSDKSSISFVEWLMKNYPGYYIIPEGGAGPLGEKGAGEILNYTDPASFTHIACAIGSATMFNGLIHAAPEYRQILGFPVLKGWTQIPATVNAYIIPEYHFGGYARFSKELVDFMNDFYRLTDIPTDFVYTGKLFYGLMDQIKKGKISSGSSILAIHSGGLQGNNSLSPGMLIF